MAHITGGGLIENVPRVLPEGVQCRHRRQAPGPARPSSSGSKKRVSIDSHEMHRVFNNGIGLVVIVSAEDAEPRYAKPSKLEGEKVFTHR